MSKQTSLALTLLIFAALPASAGPGAPGHSHSHGFSAGEPGDPNKPARVVHVAMREAGRKMLFSPDRVEVRKGEQIRFVIDNEGIYDHEFVLATLAQNRKHAELMKKYPEMEHDDPNAKRVSSYTQSEIVWRFSKRGEFEFACLIPGHREAGMTGKIVVK